MLFYVIKNVEGWMGKSIRHACLNLSLGNVLALKRAVWIMHDLGPAYFEVVYLVTALVPSLTACLASSPGRRSRTAVWTSRLVMVDFLL